MASRYNGNSLPYAFLGEIMMVRFWAAFFIFFYYAEISNAAMEEIGKESNQAANICSLLTNAGLESVTIANCSESPVNLSVVSRLFVKVAVGVKQCINAPDGWDFIAWNDLDKRGFPIIEGQFKRSNLISFANTTAAVYALNTMTLNSKEEKILTAPVHYTLSHLALKEGEKAFINIDASDNLRLSLQSTPRSFWLSIAKEYDFSRLAFQGDVMWPFLRDFRDKILPQAGIDPAKLYQRVEDCYKNYLKLSEEEKPQEFPRIPLTIHTIWLSDPKSPTEPKPEYSQWLAETMKVCPPEEGWEYIFWVNCEDMAIAKHPLAGAADTLEPFVEVRHINTLPGGTEWFKIFEFMLSKKNYGAASDILRLIILKLLGGVYRDTDFKFTQAPLILNTLLDFYSGMEGPQPIAACNAMIACRPDHPIINKALEMIVQGAIRQTCPAYLKGYPDMVLRTLLHTGPMMLTMAFYHAAGADDNHDVLLPPEFFFWPAYDQEGPRRQWPAQTSGIHYHKASWL